MLTIIIKLGIIPRRMMRKKGGVRMMQTIELLRNVSIFECLSDEILDDIAAHTRTQIYTKDSIVVNQNDPGDAIFFVASGKLKACLSGEGGREITLSLFREGDFFGEMSILDGQPRSATIIAVEDSSLVILSRRDFVNHINSSPQTAINILAEMSLRLRKADEVIGNLALLDVYGRLAHILADMAENDGTTDGDAVIINKRPTHQELASMIGASRETVSRAIADFQRRGFISIDGKIMKLNPTFFINYRDND